MAEQDVGISSHPSRHVAEHTRVPLDYVLTACDHAPISYQPSCP